MLIDRFHNSIDATGILHHSLLGSCLRGHQSG
jgi:hypothetical protein